MKNKNIDLSDIKVNDLDKTSSFTDLMSRTERRNRKRNYIEEEKIDNTSALNDIEDMVKEKKKSTADLTRELEQAKKEYNGTIEKVEDIEEKLAKTQILELTRQMKFNFEETKKENTKKRKNGITFLNIVGISNLLCIGYYIYLIVFTNYQDIKNNYLINGGIIISLVMLFGLSVITSKKTRITFNILNLIAIIGFIAFNAYILLT